MMRDLTSLHATMAAANKIGGGPRGGRRAPAPAVKQEDSMTSVPRPGTSTGYEGDLMYQQSHSFRDPGQSFLASASFLANNFVPVDIPSKPSSRPPTSSGSTDSRHPRSLPPLAAVVSASLPSPALQSASSSTSSSSSTTSAVSSAAGTGAHLFPFPGSLALRRPTTATRPGTAPASASFFSSKPFTGLASSTRPDLSLLHSGFGHGRTPTSGFHPSFHLDTPPPPGDVPMSPQPHDSSPFYFHPPNDTNPPNPSLSHYHQHPSPPPPPPPLSNSRKRPFAGPDGPNDESSYSLRGPERPPSSTAATTTPYEYGSESRPQSRRLTVMELCNDGERQQQQRNEHQYRERKEWERERDRERCSSGSGAFLLSAAAAAALSSSASSSSSTSSPPSGPYTTPSRPTTSSGLGLVTSASALHIFDNTSPPPSHPHSSSYPQPPISTSKSTGLFSKSHGPATSSIRNGAEPGDDWTGHGGFGPNGFRNPAANRYEYEHGHEYRYGGSYGNGDGDGHGHEHASIRHGNGHEHGRDGEPERSDAVPSLEATGGAATATFGADRAGGAASPAAAATLSAAQSRSFSTLSAAAAAAAPATSSPSSSTSSATPTPSTAATIAAASYRSPNGSNDAADDDVDDHGGKSSSTTDGSPPSSYGSGRGRSTSTSSSLSPAQSRGYHYQLSQWNTTIQQSEPASFEQSQQSQFRSVQQQQQWTPASAAAAAQRQQKQQQQRQQQRDDGRAAGSVRLSVSPHASAAFGMRV